MVSGGGKPRKRARGGDGCDGGQGGELRVSAPPPQALPTTGLDAAPSGKSLVRRVETAPRDRGAVSRRRVSLRQSAQRPGWCPESARAAPQHPGVPTPETGTRAPARDAVRAGGEAGCGPPLPPPPSLPRCRGRRVCGTNACPPHTGSGRDATGQSGVGGLRELWEALLFGPPLEGPCRVGVPLAGTRHLEQTPQFAHEPAFV